jgi:hypothetical protein
MMKPIVEWLIAVVGGVIGGLFPVVIAFFVAALLTPLDPFGIAGLIIVILSTILGGFGAMYGGVLAGRLIDRYNGYDNRYDDYDRTKPYE